MKVSEFKSTRYHKVPLQVNVVYYIFNNCPSVTVTKLIFYAACRSVMIKFSAFFGITEGSSELSDSG